MVLRLSITNIRGRLSWKHTQAEDCGAFVLEEWSLGGLNNESDGHMLHIAPELVDYFCYRENSNLANRVGSSFNPE